MLPCDCVLKKSKNIVSKPIIVERAYSNAVRVFDRFDCHPVAGFVERVQQHAHVVSALEDIGVETCAGEVVPCASMMIAPALPRV